MYTKYISRHALLNSHEIKTSNKVTGYNCFIPSRTEAKRGTQIAKCENLCIITTTSHCKIQITYIHCLVNWRIVCITFPE